MSPARLFAALSLCFGLAAAVINPPLRGPDEPAHFIRIVGYVQGVVRPDMEVDGRKGIFIPAKLNDAFQFFNDRRHRIWDDGFSFRNELKPYRALRARSARPDARAPVFVPFEGSEPYSPIAYAPYIIGGGIAQALGLGFVATVMIMRLAGVLLFTAVGAWAIATTPRLKWLFFLTAMLPASLYGRAVLGADGATNIFSLLATALALRALLHPGTVAVGTRVVMMTLCVLGKPPQLAFIFLEPMLHRWRDLPRRAGTVALVILPGVALTLWWIWLIDAEIAAWRVHGGDRYAAEQFQLHWKLGFMMDHPLHFPVAMYTTVVTEAFGLWRQIIGVLGWLDTFLPLWVYLAISICLVLTSFEQVRFDPSTRLRVVFWTFLIAASYVTTVFLILFVTWTPVSEQIVWGVQGRYFIPVLPVIGLLISTMFDVQSPGMLRAVAAMAGAVIGAVAVLEALWRVNWA